MASELSNQRAPVQSLYLHVPFCLKKCGYCDFFSVPADESLVRKFLYALSREARMYSSASEAGGLKTLYLGGGTPTALSAGQLEEIFTIMLSHFRPMHGAEVTVEANPGTIDMEKAALLRSLGANRLSLGVQSLEDRELRALGRVHTAEQAVKAVKAVQKAGFEEFSLDLIYGIPGQDMASWRRTLARALALGPMHISAYELTPEPGTPFMEQLRKGIASLPPEDDVAGMQHFALEALEASGLQRYEISNFAIPGHECRHNLNYWRRGQYLGLGPGAHSFREETRWKNASDIELYAQELEAGRQPVEERQHVSAEDALRERVFLGLRMTNGVNTAAFAAESGLNLVEAASEILEEGLARVEGGRLGLTARGLQLFNPVVIRILERLGL